MSKFIGDGAGPRCLDKKSFIAEARESGRIWGDLLDASYPCPACGALWSQSPLARVVDEDRFGDRKHEVIAIRRDHSDDCEYLAWLEEE